MSILMEIENLLSSLSGVIEVKRITKSAYDKITEIESLFENSAILPVKNFGTKLAFKRDFAYVILKNEGFRGPLEPTLYLVEEVINNNDGRFIINIENKKYRIIGEEILDRDISYEEKISAIEDSFVFFPDRRTDKEIPSYFILPPTSFPELEKKKHLFGIEDIIAASPSIASDEFLKTAYGFPKSNTYATLLVGFNSSEKN